MQSRWFELKPKAINLRKKGLSIVKIELLLGIPRSTLSGWFKGIELSQKQKDKLLQSKKNALVEARKKATLWHNAQKNNRLKEAESQAIELLKKINFSENKILELALSMLYLGEGSKVDKKTSLGSSNPLILKFFLSVIRNIYKIDNKKIKCQLNLRADQNINKMKKFWSKELDIPIKNFGYVGVDKRTAGSKTYSSYNGVCQIHCANVAIQRKLVFLGEIFCKRIVEKYSGV
ncbi:MAG: hypothetical protein Q7R99_03810 [bacterium]|nr:hypothetical protein [bacterium]